MKKVLLILALLGLALGTVSCISEDDDSDLGAENSAQCAIGSGWPCACTSGVCEDGSYCMAISGLGGGPFCSKSCETYADCDNSYPAVGSCSLSGFGGAKSCLLTCNKDEDCPSGQDCLDSGSQGVCTPIIEE